MKAIILAAGRGTRLKPITDTIPKPLIHIRGKSILEYFLEQIHAHVSEIVLIVNYKQEMFQEAFWSEYCGVPITYHVQGEKKWTGWAIEGIESQEDVFIFYADAIFENADIHTLINHNGYGCLVQEVERPEKYGIFHQDANGNALEVIEKPQQYIGNLANLWVYKFSCQILELVKTLSPSPRGEYELTDAINIYCKTQKLQLFPTKWMFLDISYPQDIETAEKRLKDVSQKHLEEIPSFWTSVFLGNLKNFQIHLGIKETLIPQLIEHSQNLEDIDLQKNTGDKKRFSDTEKIRSWYQQWRYVFTLISQKWELAGIWWARPCTLPKLSKIANNELWNEIGNKEKNLHTNAIRIYPNFRGQRIGTPFISDCSMYYRDMFPNAIMCIDTDSDNIPLQKVYEKKWYTLLGTGVSNKSVIGTRERILYIQKS